MYTVVFKNGKEIAISQEMAEVLYKNIIIGCKQWQNFSNNNDEVRLILNLNEVVCIIPTPINQ